MGLAIGGTIGAVAGAFGGRVDTVLMRITDVLLAIPGILLAIAIVVALDRGLPQIMFAVAVTNAPIFARILRGSMLVAPGVRLRDGRAVDRRPDEPRPVPPPAAELAHAP